jgi:hypothetical protein
MAQNNHARRFTEAPSAVVRRFKELLQQLNHSEKQWLKSSEVRKMLGIPMAIGTHGTLQNLRIKNLIPYQNIGGLMFYKYDDIVKKKE